MSGIPSQELRLTAREMMRPFIERLIAQPETVAVAYLSTTANTTATEHDFTPFSDFDICLLIDVPYHDADWHSRSELTMARLADRLPRWLPNFSFGVEVAWGRMEVNVHTLVLGYEHDPRTVWDYEKTDAYQNKCEPVVDHGGVLAEIIRRRCDRRQELDVDTDRLGNRLTWDISVAPLSQLVRVDSLAAQFLLNCAIEETLDLLFTSNHAFPPSRKWKTREAVRRGYVSPLGYTLLAEALRCDPDDVRDVERRISALSQFAIECGFTVTDPAWVATTRSRFFAHLEKPDSSANELTASVDDLSERQLLRDRINYWLASSEPDLEQSIRSVGSSADTADLAILDIFEARRIRGE